MHLSCGRSRPRRPARALTLITAAASLAGLTVAASLAGAVQPAREAAPAAPAADAACPWVGSSAPISQRVSQLLARMTVAQKVSVLTGPAGRATSGSPRLSGRCAFRP